MPSGDELDGVGAGVGVGVGVGDDIDDGIVRGGVEVAAAAAAVVAAVIASVAVAIDVSINDKRQFEIRLGYCPPFDFGRTVLSVRVVGGDAFRLRWL